MCSFSFDVKVRVQLYGCEFSGTVAGSEKRMSFVENQFCIC